VTKSEPIKIVPELFLQTVYRKGSSISQDLEFCGYNL
jgi:hypothetical protein